MLSFIDLPPEIRLVIYKILLQHTLAKDTRILYFGDNPLRCGVFPDRIRHKQPFRRVGSPGDIKFLNTRTDLASHIALKGYVIHLADIDDLLFLASTCRLTRSEILALAWSNADIRIESPETYNDLHCIFYDRLTSQSCEFIRTLQFNVIESEWSPSESGKIVGLVRSRLERLELLIVTILARSDPPVGPLTPGIAALRGLPLRIAVNLRYYHRFYLRRTIVSSGKRKDASKNARLQSLRAEIGLICQKRKEEQSKKDQGDQACEILEATAEMRSLMVG